MRSRFVSFTENAFFFFFFSAPATPEIYTLSLHDALPISVHQIAVVAVDEVGGAEVFALDRDRVRSEEHTSELQSRGHLVCRLLLEKKKIQIRATYMTVELERERILTYNTAGRPRMYCLEM